MPKAYVIFTEAIHDQAGMDAYGQAAMVTLAQSGARVLAFDAQPQALEGDWHGGRTVILEFDSVEAARDWYESPAYQQAIPLRLAAADTNAAIIAGLLARVLTLLTWSCSPGHLDACGWRASRASGIRDGR